MERTLVLDTKTFALGLYQLLRELDPSRWQSARKQALTEKILKLETEVYSLYSQMQDRSSELETQPEYPLSALRDTLGQVGELLTALKAVQIDSHLSYLALYSLRKRLQKAYRQLSIMMAACQAPIPDLRPTNIMRSVVHCANAVGTLLIIAAVPSFSWTFWITLAFVLFCVTMETLKRVNAEVKKKVMRFFAAIAHPHEYDKVNSASWYGLSLLFLSLMPLPLGIISVAILGFADPAAALVGRRYGRIQLPGNRTLEGSMTFWVVGTLASSVALNLMHPVGGMGITLLVSALAALAGALGELFGGRLDDNFTIPLTSAGGAFLALSLSGLI